VVGEGQHTGFELLGNTRWRAAGKGGLLPIGLVVLTLSPVVAARLRR